MCMDNSIQQVYLDMELCKYTKKPILLVIQLVSLGLLIFNSPNIDYHKLVFIDKLELIIKVIINRFSFNRVFQYMQTKLVQEYTFIDPINTFNSTLILKYSPKLLEFSLIYIKVIYIQYFRIVITISKYKVNASYMKSLNCI